ncbi:MAG: tetratricopeptide repeat protein [Oligoflexia bacterium]|nr:tetratricopeptide repeat protein [Oligoflexia bacterium]
MAMSTLTLPGTAALGAEPADRVESHPGMLLEVEYSEAVFEFTNKRYLEAVKILDSLLQQKPDHFQALELKALSLKTVGNDAASVDVYEKLIKYKPRNERAPYHFELGMIFYRQKRLKEARPHLLRSIQGKFNVGVSHFFLGSIDFQNKEFRDAINHYRAAIPGVPDDLKVACHYYIGMIHAQRGYGPGATHSLMIARESAARIDNNDMARDLGAAAAKALAPYDKATWFGSISYQQQYDGNVSNISSSVSPEDATGKVSVKSNISFNGGYVGSPMRAVQTMATYRFNFNKNFNSDALDYEFATNTLSAYFTFQPLMKTNFGVKLEGNHGFQNRQDPATSKYGFRPYSYSGEVGPFLRAEFSETLHFSAEANYRAQTFNNDGTGTNVRSGNLIIPRLSLKIDTTSMQFNPTISGTYELNRARGSDQRSRTILVDLSNPIPLPSSHILSLGISAALTSYPERSPEIRSDTTLSARVGWQKPVSRKLALTGDASYSANLSNIPTVYSYKKPTVAFGLNYSL